MHSIQYISVILDDKLEVSPFLTAKLVMKEATGGETLQMKLNMEKVTGQIVAHTCCI